VDILNNHHAAYYQKAEPPGDWENPIPVYFLAVEPKTTFEFALTKRRPDVPDQLASLAKEWLLGALCHLGAGAKTNSGYGAFKPVTGDRPAFTSAKHKAFEATLELVTPAFLAGANQQAADCDLRPATLRGLLRWWWRTLHAGFVDEHTLRQMEAAVWGDTSQSGAVRLNLERVRIVGPGECPGKRVGRNNRGQTALEPDPDFVREHGIESAPRATTQGLFYAAYGTDEMKAGNLAARKRRWFADAGSQWKIRFVVRPWTYEERDSHGRLLRRIELPTNSICQQALAALWLLCHFGGVGSKARKAFGSFADPQELADWSRDSAQRVAEEFRTTWHSHGLPFRAGRCDSLALSNAQSWSLQTPWTNSWFALDQLGASRQAFAQADSKTGHGKHCPAKVALGLPRNIHKAPPEKLFGPMGDRYASPVFFHFAKVADGKLQVRVLAFGPPRLWAMGHHDEQTGPQIIERTLQQLLEHLDSDLSSRSQRLANRGQAKVTVSAPSRAATGVIATDKVRVKVLAKHSLPNSFRVQEEGVGKKPGILQFGTPPARLPEPGETVEVYRHNTNPQSPQYRWDPLPRPQSQQRRGGPPRGRR
jgi:CRISPR-associated protein Cmr6